MGRHLRRAIGTAVHGQLQFVKAKLRIRIAVTIGCASRLRTLAHSSASGHRWAPCKSVLSMTVHCLPPHFRRKAARELRSFFQAGVATL